MLEEHMTELEKLCEQALYEEMKVLEDGRSIVRDTATGKLLFRKRLTFYNPEVFAWLKAHSSRYVPRIESFWQDGDELVVIEELIQGKTLEQILEEADHGDALPFGERIRILTEICNGLSFLHQADPPIIHRDLKPSNIMLTDDGVVKIIDYDAAKLYVEGQKRDTQLIGTQGMAAPEQYGFAASDPRTDIYALGKLIERMLPANADAARIARKATNLDPAKRYASASQIRESIKKVREKPSGLDSLLEKFPGYDPSRKKHRLAARFGIAALCALFLAAGVFCYVLLIKIPMRQQEAYASALKNISDVRTKPDEIAEVSKELLQERPYDKLSVDEQAMFREIAELLVRKCTSDKEGTPQETGLFLSDICMSYLNDIQQMGVDGPTAQKIRICGQIRYLILKKKWGDALKALEFLKGLPNEELERENVYKMCAEASDKHLQDFQEDASPTNATSALKFYSQIAESGYPDGEELLKNYYETVLDHADAKRDAGDYALADKFYKVLLSYEEEVKRNSSEPGISEKIRENGYLEAKSEMDGGDYVKARNGFLQIADYKDAAALADECAYLRAEKLLASQNYEQAVSFYEEIPGYKNADEQCLMAKFKYCEIASENADETAYGYIAELLAAGYPGAEKLSEKIYTWHAKVETGMSYMIGAEQGAEVRATLSGGPPDGSTHIRFELIDQENGTTYDWTSEVACKRGESYSAYYRVSSLDENIFEKKFTVNIYADDGSKIGSFSGCFSMEFLPDE